MGRRDFNDVRSASMWSFNPLHGRLVICALKTMICTKLLIHALELKLSSVNSRFCTHHGLKTCANDSSTTAWSELPVAPLPAAVNPNIHPLTTATCGFLAVFRCTEIWSHQILFHHSSFVVSPTSLAILYTQTTGFSAYNVAHTLNCSLFLLVEVGQGRLSFSERLRGKKVPKSVSLLHLDVSILSSEFHLSIPVVEDKLVGNRSFS